MKKNIFISAIPYTLLAIGFLLPLAASAAVSLPYFGGSGSGLPFASCTGVNCTTCDLFETGQRVIYFIMTLALFVFGPIMVTIGGIMMLISGGNEERFSGGKKMATGAVIGILIALAAFLIVNTLLATIAKQITGFSGSGFTISCSAISPVAPAAGTTNQQGTFMIPGTDSSNFKKCSEDTAGNVTCQQCTEDMAGNITCQ